MQELYLYLSLPVIIFVGWMFTAAMVSGSLPVLRNKAIVLLIAHPDDEAMFFAPSVLALTRPELGNHLKILCLSNGNADGLGEIRRHEIVQSGLRLGLRSEADVLVLDEPEFQDSMTATWAAQDIASTLDSFFLRNDDSENQQQKQRRRRSASTALTPGVPPETTIDALITFDAGGVSGHPNHISLFHGATAWARSLLRSGYDAPVKVYTLTSVNVARKYSGVLDAPFTLAWNAGGSISWNKKNKTGGTKVTSTKATSSSSTTDRSSGKRRPESIRATSAAAASAAAARDWPQRIMFLSSVGEWLTARGAMVHAHRSQMRWFRWGWISLGRYMVVNDLRRAQL